VFVKQTSTSSAAAVIVRPRINKKLRTFSENARIYPISYGYTAYTYTRAKKKQLLIYDYDDSVLAL